MNIYLYNGSIQLLHTDSTNVNNYGFYTNVALTQNGNVITLSYTAISGNTSGSISWVGGTATTYTLTEDKTIIVTYTKDANGNTATLTKSFTYTNGGGTTDEYTNITSLFSFTNNKMQNSEDGSLSDSTQFKTSGLVDISSYSSLKIAFLKWTTNSGTYSNIGLAFYDASGNYISGQAYPFEAKQFYELEIDKPSGAKYVKTSYVMDEATYGAFYCYAK